MVPSKLELLRQALAEIGEASAEELSAHLEQRHGVKVEPRFIPFLRASLLEADIVETVRQTARALAEQASKARDKDDKTSKAKTLPDPGEAVCEPRSVVCLTTGASLAGTKAPVNP